MWFETPTMEEDLRQVCEAAYIPWEWLRRKTVLITGGTGLIGSTLVNTLLYADMRKSLGLTVLALVRDPEKAAARFSSQMKETAALRLLPGSVETFPKIDGDIDFIIHGASPTASRYFIRYPVETIRTIVCGTERLLELAREKNAGFVYLSSMEAYGAPSTDEPITETGASFVDTMSVRSCYPEAKRLCENLCAAYASEYGVSAKAVRLAQTIGPGGSDLDSRAAVEFARAALAGKDIVLQTPGTSRRTCLYTADAASAILTVLLRGEAGSVYNAANRTAYCSIYEMAQLAAGLSAGGRSRVIVRQDGDTAKYPPASCLNLDTSRLEGLGWSAERSITEMFERMMSTMRPAQTAQ